MYAIHPYFPSYLFESISVLTSALQEGDKVDSIQEETNCAQRYPEETAQNNRQHKADSPKNIT